MALEFSHRKTYREVTYTVIGTSDVKGDYINTTLRPDLVLIRDDGEQIQKVIAYGPNVKKDGKTGANRHDASFDAQPGRYGRPVPLWLEPLLTHHAAANGVAR